MAASSVIMECFLGMKSHNSMILDQKINKFLIILLDDFVEQMIDPISFILGPKLLKLGLREKDRNLQKRFEIFNHWSKQFIE